MAKVIVREGWRGLGSGGEWIEAGSYDDHNDPRLFGQGKYLVSVGRAQWVDAPPAVEPEPDEVEYPDFNKLKLDGIDVWMNDNNVTAPVGWSDMLKAERVIWLEDELEGVHADNED